MVTSPVQMGLVAPNLRSQSEGPRCDRPLERRICRAGARRPGLPANRDESYQAQCAASEDVRMTTPSRSHLEIGFEVWEDGESWFWLVVSPHSDGGTIGAAATEAEAIRDARSSIEDPSE